MSEAEKETNSLSASVNSVNSTANETLAKVIVPESQTGNREVINCVTFSSSCEASENYLTAIAPRQSPEIITLIQALSSSNGNLIERVTQLEQALSECLEALQSHKKRSRMAESMLTQKTEELTVAQEQIKSLSQETAPAHQIAQRQQSLIETLTAQLQSSQERFAQLEWEHYLTQASYKDQSEQLNQTENTCRELRTRLTRQQHYTLQLKVALEKCLETSRSRYQSEADIDVIPTHLKSEQGRFQCFFSKAESIPPWSAQPHCTNGLEPDLSESSVLADVQTSTYDHYSILDCSDEDLGTLQAESITLLETDELISLEEVVSVDPFNHHVGDHSLLSQLGELIESSIDSSEIHFSNEDVTEPEQTQRQALLNLLETVEEQETTNSLELPTSVAPYPAISASDQLADSLNDSNLAEDLLDTNTESISPDHTTQTPQQQTNSFTPNSNWPSPLVYPSHPHKRRKPLTAIELPTFIQNRG